jgi:D-glycero-D-manno-heptose 1,7-bisphosphate phosphatase
MSVQTAIDINRRLVELIQSEGGRIDGVYMCPHQPEDDCQCRKPKPGLLLRAAEELSLNVAQSWMIGDAWTDVQTGQRAGVRQTILLRTGRGAEQLGQRRPADIQDTLVFDNLPLALNAILAVSKTTS